MHCGGPADACGESQTLRSVPGHAAVFFHLRPLDGDACLSQVHSWAPLQVLHGDNDVLFPVSGVGSCASAGECFLILFSLPSELWL